MRSRSIRTVLLVMAAWSLSACVSSPEKKSDAADAPTIQFVENQSVDLAVRQEFSAALKLLQSEQYPEAIERLKKVIAGSQNNSAPYINIAMAYSRLDKGELAEENLKKAMEINPDHPVTLNEYALLYRKTGRYVEARQFYQQLLKRYPDYMLARKNYGILCELYLNDPPCAVEQYEIYSKARPDDEDVKLWLTGLQQ